MEASFGYKAKGICEGDVSSDRKGLRRALTDREVLSQPFPFALFLEQFEDVMGEDHEDDVEDPDDVPAQENAEQSAHPMSFFEPGHETEDPRSDGDDAKD